jgi:hypothetical protein
LALKRESGTQDFPVLNYSIAPSYTAVATPARRKRGPSLSRRTGQAGTVFQHCKTCDPTAPSYGKFWADVPGSPERVRRTIPLGVCRTKTVARQRLRDYIQREAFNSTEAFHQNTAPGINFRQQAEWWIASLPARKRRPVKPATISGWRDALNAWLLPHLGDKLLADVSNSAVHELVEKMSEAGLSPKTIVNYVQVVKLVVASAVNEEGEQIYPRKWNHDFIQLPIVRRDQQRRPAVTETDLREILATVKNPQYSLLFALLAGTGLRIGEALALRSTDFGPGARAKDGERRARCRHSRGSRKGTSRLCFRRVRLSIRHSARPTLTAAKRPSHPAQGQTSRLSRFSPFPSDLAPKERRPKRPGAHLDGTCL